MKMMQRLERLVLATPDKIPSQCDVIVACGIGLDQEDRSKVSPQSAQVAWTAAQLYQQDVAQNVICCGGVPFWQWAHTTEAEAMAELLRQYVDPILERCSRTTSENAVNCMTIMREKCWRRAVVITQQLTLGRARDEWQAVARNGFNEQRFELSFTSAHSRYGGNCLMRWNSLPAALAWDIAARFRWRP